MKFIHTADIHLGAKPDDGMVWAKNRDDELWDTFYRLLDEVEQSQVDLLMIAGDLFDRTPSRRELKEVNDHFSKLSRAKVVMIAGDHDYIHEQSPYNDFVWAENVYFFRKNHVSYFYIQEINTIVYGMSYDREIIEENLYNNFNLMHRLKNGTALPEDCCHIVMAHGGDSRHIPLNLNKFKFRKENYYYVALGHQHQPFLYNDVAIAYAGSLEPLGVNEQGEHGYIKGSINKMGVKIQFIPFSSRSYLTLEIEMNADMTQFQLYDTIKRKISVAGNNNIYCIVLKGVKDIDVEIDKDTIMRFGNIYSVTDKTVPNFDFKQIYEENQDNMIGFYIRRVSEMDVSEKIKNKALNYGLKALYKIT